MAYNELISLDDYIKQAKANGDLCRQDMKKKFNNIDKDELDQELDEITNKNTGNKCSGKSCGTRSKSKFERYQDCDSSDDDELKCENSSIRFAKEVAKLDCPACDQSKPFTTVEQQRNVKIPSVQHRLGRIDNKPNGLRKTQNRRIQKNNNVKSGAFIDKGNFTFKYSNQEDNIVGIVSNTRRRMRFTTANHVPAQSYMPPINISVNFNDLLSQGNISRPSMSRASSSSEIYQRDAENGAFERNHVPRGSFQTEQMRKSNGEISVKVAAAELLKAIEEKERNRASDIIPDLIRSSQKLVYGSNKSINLVQDDYQMDEVNDVPDLVGGINDLKVYPSSTGMSMHMRYA